MTQISDMRCVTTQDATGSATGGCGCFLYVVNFAKGDGQMLVCPHCDQLPCWPKRRV